MTKTTFSLHDFVMKTLKGMSETYAEFQIREFALSWYSSKVLTDADLMEIESWYLPITTEPNTAVGTDTVI